MKCKKIVVILIISILTIFNLNHVFAETNSLNLNAKSAILIDNKTNKILYEKNINQKMYPASTTKIVTAILTLENSNLSDKVTASYNAVMSIPDGYSTADIQIGEVFTIEQLLEILLVYSANDAANVLAEHIGGSIDSFVSMMNTKIHDIGLQNTNFTNTYGKHDDNHYTTAYDLSKIMQYCLKNETFRNLAGKASCAIPATNMHNPRLYKSTNELIIPNSKFYYSNLTAGKTGFTTQAGECLVSVSYKNDLEFICVVLGCSKNSNNRFIETKKIYDYGYENYLIKNIAMANDVGTQIQVDNATSETRNLDLLVAETIPALVNISDDTFSKEITLNENISAPIEEGIVLGKITYTAFGIEYSTDLIAAHNVEKSKVLEYSILAGTITLIIILAILYLSKKYSNTNKKDM